MSSLLAQLRSDLPSTAHRRRVYYSADLTEAERIARRARELNLTSIRFLLSLERFEVRPPDGHTHQAAYDVLIAALNEVVPELTRLAASERSTEKSED